MNKNVKYGFFAGKKTSTYFFEKFWRKVLRGDIFCNRENKFLWKLFCNVSQIAII